MGHTTHPMYSRILLARSINEMSGGLVVAPWELDELSEDWLDAFRELQAAINQKAKG